MLYSQLGLTEEIFKGTADEATMLNYQNRTLIPIVEAITEAMNRTFLSRTARTQGQAIDYRTDPFRLVPLSQLAELGDKLLRNKILSANEFRAVIGYRPMRDGVSDTLSNPNMPADKDGPSSEVTVEAETEDSDTRKENLQNGT